MLLFYLKKYRYVVYGAGMAALLGSGVFFVFLLRPVQGSDTTPIEVTIERGDGLNEIAARLKSQNLIRSTFVFKFLAVITFRAHLLHPGDYVFSAVLSTPEMINRLVLGGRDEVTVVIPEGWSAKDIDALLSKEKVTHQGDLIAFASKEKLEGYLFPDTYRFYVGSDVAVVAEKFLQNFKAKAGALVGEGVAAKEKLTLASMLEKEVPDQNDRKIIAGILLKRLAAGWPLQVDSTICYIKPPRQSSQPLLGYGGQAGQAQNCYPLTPLDFKIDSPYNTYLYKGLPPAPIANPGLNAIESALNPADSRYWFYLSDPKTHKTFFAKTLEEQTKNKRLILP